LPDGSHRAEACLIARSCADIQELSAKSKAATLAGAAHQREILAGLLREGVAAGELTEDADIDAMAWHYFGVLQAELNFAQAGADRGMLDRMIDVAMSAWPVRAQR
jgi:TetR/AcrR family transcriptional regulator, copper-responsive repressor